ncbi:ATP-binding protein [Terasakiispira papahanaumokuakeensis]|uniref:ATP-binding protein n=1 Tax=Terasakiispira papahanaumokuakeensis TaxID=197479 RepID=A0A1E2V7K7_9GAMM|nr:DUF2062 domain-containing protein [Terasakiispira papahanaumokuakeensis]ODC02967.1 ATP-binding protein [Terasakiispira papahanaumokuakeensis]
MPRKFIKRYMPKPEKLQQQKSLRFLARFLADPSLWMLTRRSVAWAFSVGIFCAFLPMPFQMVAAAVLASFLRCNLPISVGLVWITNPLTMPVIFYATYVLGSWMLSIPPHEKPPQGVWDWMMTQFNDIWPPLLTGSIAAGLVFALLSHFAIRLIWRWHVARAWQQRQQKRYEQPKTSEPNSSDEAK